MILARQREPIDPDRFISASLSKCVLQENVDRRASIRSNSTRQRHVKSELLEHIRISPAVEIGGLVSAQSSRQAPASFLCGHGQAESLEGRDAVRRKPVKRR